MISLHDACVEAAIDIQGQIRNLGININFHLVDVLDALSYFQFFDFL